MPLTPIPPARPTGTLYKPMAEGGSSVPAFRAVAFKGGVAYDVAVSVDVRRLERQVADALEQWADTIGNPAYDNTYRSDDGLTFQLTRRED